jgi:hypothetical protein
MLATPVRSVTASDVRTPPAVTAYDPGWATSEEWLKAASASLGSAGTAPVSGRIGKSPATAQPGPEKWVKLKPVMSESA